MKSKFKFCIAFLATAVFFSSCGNDTNTTTTNTKDSSATQSSNTAKDTMSHGKDQSNTENMNQGGLMSAMNSMMDRMHSMKMSGDFDTDWTNMMIEHHQGAIDMAQVELSQGKDEKMKAKAQEIITKQKEEQDKMKDMVKNMKPSDMKMGQGELEKSMTEMMDKMKNMQMSGDVDKDFATMMMQHHQDGISMAKKEVANGMNAELKKLAQKSITDQQKDISEFKNWLGSHK